MEKTDEIMRSLGFSDTDAGPLVTQLREFVARSDMERMHISWGPEAHTLTAEERAQSLLAWEWEVKNGASYQRETMDPIVRRRRTVEEMVAGRWGRLEIRWRRVPAWLRDRGRQAAMIARLAMRRLRGIKNPYASA